MYKNTKKEVLMRIFSIILHNILFVSCQLLVILQHKTNMVPLESKTFDWPT